MTHLVLAFLFALALQTPAVSPQPTSAGLEGVWEGTLAAGASQLRVVLNMTKTTDGIYLGTLTSVDQGGVRISIDRIDVTNDVVRLEMNAINGIFAGSINGNQMKGTWTQGGPTLPLEFKRTSAGQERGEAASGANAPPATADPFGIPVEMTVPAAPVPFQAGNKTHLVYELHITNLGVSDVLMQRLEVFSGEKTLAVFEGTELNSILARPGRVDLPDQRNIGAGLRAIAFVWVTQESGLPIPGVLRHRITQGAQSVEGGIVAVSPATPIVLGPPLRGSDWIAVNGPANDSAHRRALFPGAGKVTNGQRFAIDWVQLGADQKTFSGNPKDNKNYLAYGKDVLAVADGVVTSIKDGIPENIPGPVRAVPITPETIGGNSVILDLGGGHFGFYAHFQPGSLRVKLGDRVRRGQVLGLVGNSGNSTEPHVHFHISDGNSPLGSEGLPHLLESFEVRNAAGSWERRRNELPQQNARVRFSQ